MDSMLSGMKRAAAVLQTTAKGSGDLGMAIYHQKEVAESWSKLSHAKLDLTKALATWGKGEGEAMMQFFENQNQLEGMMISLLDEMVRKYDYNRRCYKEILKGEKTLEDLMEKKKEWETKVSKQTKQFEGSRRGKQKTLEPELLKAKAALEQAKDDLERHAKNHARFKFQKLAEAYKDNAAIQLKFHSDARRLAQAQAKLNQVYLQDNFTHYPAQKLHALTIEAQTILNNLTESLNDSKIDSLQEKRGSQKSYDSSDGAWDFDDYRDHPQQEIPEAYDEAKRNNANRPLPPVPGSPQVYDNNPVPQGDYLEMDYAEYEPYIQPQPSQRRSEEYLNVYVPIIREKEPAAKPLGDLMEEMKLEQKNKHQQQQQDYQHHAPPPQQGYFEMEPQNQDRAVPNPYAPAPGYQGNQQQQQQGQLYPTIHPDGSPPDGAEFLPPPPPEMLNQDGGQGYDKTSPHEFV